MAFCVRPYVATPTGQGNMCIGWTILSQCIVHTTGMQVQTCLRKKLYLCGAVSGEESASFPHCTILTWYPSLSFMQPLSTLYCSVLYGQLKLIYIMLLKLPTVAWSVNNIWDSMHMTSHSNTHSKYH